VSKHLLRHKVNVGWKKLHHKELGDLYITPCVSLCKPGILQLTDRVPRRERHTVFGSVNLGDKRPLPRPGKKWENNCMAFD
jgi:hypothetical protein